MSRRGHRYKEPAEPTYLTLRVEALDGRRVEAVRLLPSSLAVFPPVPDIVE